MKFVLLLLFTILAVTLGAPHHHPDHSEETEVQETGETKETVADPEELDVEGRRRKKPHKKPHGGNHGNHGNNHHSHHGIDTANDIVGVIGDSVGIADTVVSWFGR